MLLTGVEVLVAVTAEAAKYALRLTILLAELLFLPIIAVLPKEILLIHFIITLLKRSVLENTALHFD